MFTQKGNEVWLWSNGDLKRINVCRLQPYESEEDMKEDKGDGLKDEIQELGKAEDQVLDVPKDKDVEDKRVTRSSSRRNKNSKQNVEFALVDETVTLFSENTANVTKDRENIFSQKKAEEMEET